MNVVAAVVEVGHFDADRGETVVEVFAETAVFHRFEQVDVGGGHDPDVGFLHRAAADFEKFAGLEHAEQAGLGGEGKFGDFIEEYGASVGLFEITFAGRDGSGEGPFFVAEEFAVDGAFGDGAAVHGYIFLMFSGAELVDYLGEEFFARSAFAGDEHGEVERGHADGPGDGLQQKRRVSDDGKALLRLDHRGVFGEREFRIFFCHLIGCYGRDLSA